MTTRTFKSPPPEGSRRANIENLNENLDARFAVFRRSPSGSRAYFKRVHTDIEAAIEASRAHAAESVAYGDTDFTYFVVELKYRVGIEHGKPVDMKIGD